MTEPHRWLEFAHEDLCPDALPGIAPEGLPTRRDAEEAVALLRDALGWIEGRISQSGG
jgi:hypothetical protein